MPDPPPDFSVDLTESPRPRRLDMQTEALSDADSEADDVPAAVGVLRRLEIDPCQEQHLHQRQGHGVEDLVVVDAPGPLIKVVGHRCPVLGRDELAELAAEGEDDVEGRREDGLVHLRRGVPGMVVTVGLARP